MTIEQSQFDAQLPALRNPDSQVYDRCLPFLEAAAAALEALTGISDFSADPAAQTYAMRHVCAAAAFEAVPHLDLISTPTGFGVVSNQHVSPASKERVAALREQLRREKSMAVDMLVFRLLTGEAEGFAGWAQSARAAAMLAPRGLLWCPTLCRRYGIKAGQREGGECEVFDEEYALLGPRLDWASDQTGALISHALLSRLAAADRNSTDRALPDVAICQELARLHMATILTARTVYDTHRSARRLLEAVRKANFTEYAQSAECEAQYAPRYQNQQAHPTFFFN